MNEYIQGSRSLVIWNIPKRPAFTKYAAINHSEHDRNPAKERTPLGISMRLVTAPDVSQTAERWIKCGIVTFYFRNSLLKSILYTKKMVPPT